MSYPKKIINWHGRKISMAWINLVPTTQAYCICFNDKDEVLILNQKGDDTWTLPGGTVEEGETLEQALIREVNEEADITLKNIMFLGVQKVDDPGKRGTYFQARYIAQVDNILSQTVDPALGKINERKWVPNSEITNYIKWGKTGEAIFSDAIKLNNSKYIL